MGAFKELQDEGKVRWIGLSNCTVEQLEEALQVAEIVSVQNQLSLGYTSPLAKGEVDACTARGLAFFPWSPLGGIGKSEGTGDVDPVRAAAEQHGVSPQQVALAWLLSLGPDRDPDPRRQPPREHHRLGARRRARALARGARRDHEGGRARQDLVEESVPLRGAALQVLRPRDAEALLDERAFEHEEYLPYWAELWPSGVALARRVAARALKGARVLELGCGLGLPSLAAALAGGRVLATDWSPQAIELLHENASATTPRSRRRSSTGSARQAIVERAPWDLVLGADLSTSAATSRRCSTLLPRLLATGASSGSPTPAGRPPSEFLAGSSAGPRTRPRGASAPGTAASPPAASVRPRAFRHNREMARSIWSGAISFGLVNVPVKLYSAVSRKTVRFHQLNSETGHRVAQKRVDSVNGDEVPYEKIVKGFELTKERYVVVTPEELDSIAPEKTRAIDIEDFVDLEDIDPIFYDHPYYLVPDKGAGKAYGLLLEAMRESGKVAIARVVLRSKEQLVAIRPAAGDVLTMETMIFHDEVVPPTTSTRSRRQGPQDLRPRAEDGPAADRVAGVGLRALQVPRRVPREGARADRAQGRRRGDRDPARGGGAREGPRPDGGARGEPRRGQGPGRRRASTASPTASRRRRREAEEKSSSRAKAGAKK